MKEFNDVYDKHRNKLGRVHLRGTPWRAGEYGLAVCVWIYDGRGKLLLTKRDEVKTFGGTWENTGGAVRAGESSLQAIVREVREETGIYATEEEFELLGTNTHRHMHFDHYCLHSQAPIEEIVLQPGETVEAKWMTFPTVHILIRRKKICRIIAQQFLQFEKVLWSKTKNTEEKDKDIS